MNFICKSNEFLTSAESCEAQKCTLPELYRTKLLCLFYYLETNHGGGSRSVHACDPALRSCWGYQPYRLVQSLCLCCKISTFHQYPCKHDSDQKQQPGIAIANSESGCSPTNWTCICSSPAYLVGSARYSEQYCNPADQKGKLRSFTPFQIKRVPCC